MKVPTSYGDLSVKDFLKVCEILDSKADQFDKEMELLTFFLGYDANEIPFKQTGLKRLYKANLNYYLKRIRKLINSEKPKYAKNTIWVGNKRYYTPLDAEAFNANQYTAFSTYTQNGQAEKNIAKCLALVFYRHKYFTSPSFNADNIKEIESDIMNARLKDAYGVLLFFCMVAEQSTALFHIYLMRKEEEINNEIQELIRTSDLDNSMVGITS